MAFETEVKYPLRNPREVVKRLGRLGRYLGASHQVDTYFTSVHDDFLRRDPVEEWLRLRVSDKGNSVALKRWVFRSGVADSCQEHEAVVDDVEAMEMILRRLGAQEAVVVDKRRRAWDLDGITVAIDDVCGLGSFIEAELVSDQAATVAVVAALDDVLRRLGAHLGERDRLGYPLRILRMATDNQAEAV